MTRFGLAGPSSVGAQAVQKPKASKDRKRRMPFDARWRGAKQRAKACIKRRKAMAR